MAVLSAFLLVSFNGIGGGGGGGAVSLFRHRHVSGSAEETVSLSSITLGNSVGTTRSALSTDIERNISSSMSSQMAAIVVVDWLRVSYTTMFSFISPSTSICVLFAAFNLSFDGSIGSCLPPSALHNLPLITQREAPVSHSASTNIIS